MSENTNEVVEKTVSEETPSPTLPHNMGQGEGGGIARYLPGHRIMHEDGRIGTVLNYGTYKIGSPEHGKRFVVRLYASPEVWAKDDLDDTFENVGSQVKHADGRTAAVLDSNDGVYVVMPHTKEETWALEEIAGLADEIIRCQAFDEMQAQIDRLAREKDELQEEYDDLQEEYDDLEDSFESLAKAIPLPRRQVKTKMLVRSTILNGETSSKAFHEMTTGELDTYLSAGWEILVKDTHTVYNASSEKIELVQVFILRWDGREGEGVKPDEPKQAPPSKLPPMTPIQASKILFEGDDEDEVIPDEMPESDPAAKHEGRPFAELLRDPDLTIDEIKSFGNLIALKRGQSVFEARQNTRRAPVPALPFG